MPWGSLPIDVVGSGAWACSLSRRRIRTRSASCWMRQTSQRAPQEAAEVPSGCSLCSQLP
eukprot:8609922-Pyramimonas_sp.AAC.1